MTPLHWYLASVVVAWALHVVWDATATHNGRLQAPVFYVAFAIVWPAPVMAMLLLPALRAAHRRLRRAKGAK